MHADLVGCENYLLNSCQDFSATYMAVSRMEYDLTQNVSLASSRTVEALHHVIQKNVHASQRQSYFLYRKAAKTLLYLASGCDDRELAVKSILEQMSHTLAAGGRIEVRGFGSFSLHYRPPRMGRNPKTGESVALSSKYVPHFKPGRELRERVNNRFQESLKQ